MQRKAPLTPQARKVNRPLGRATMAPADFSVIGVPPGRQAFVSRQSVIPGLYSANESIGRKPDLPNHDAEIKRLYNTYLQTEAIKILMKSKMEEKEKKNVIKLAALIKEEQEIKKNLSLVKIRTTAVQNLSQLQNTVDDQLFKTTGCLDDLKKKAKNVLEQLELMLESLDVLKCKNIAIPETVDDMNKIHAQLTDCVVLLSSIKTVIGGLSNTLITVNKELEDLKNIFTDLSNCSEKIVRDLEHLQIRVLKEGEKILMLARSSHLRE
ncbi:uncharacterized protein [Venturia canescens]|uniref:uncharacterized protein n=1 Tax=Venturia canescens TaxID=32260 RepID=UPI001C9BCA8E|nr:uncharacterized protein LOC122417583 [Venturia canescens]